MDCRRIVGVALGFSLLCSGCVPSSGLSLSSSSESEPPKRQAKPSTCIALGKLSEDAAADGKRSPAEQERLWDNARQAYQQALQTSPNDLDALRALARLYSTMGDHEHAVATYTRAVKGHPRDPSLFYDLGMCHAHAKTWEPAIENLRHAVQLDPEQRLYAHSLGFCLARVGQYDESFAVFAKVDGEANAHYSLARMLHHLQQDDKAKEHLRLALRVKPDLAPAQQLLTVLETPGTAADKAAAWDVIQNTN